MKDRDPLAAGVNDMLQARAGLLAQLRAFMAANQVLEVDTPVLSPCANTDPQVESPPVSLNLPGAPGPAVWYLSASPEFAMKRLLADGSGSIYQICKAFRNGEQGRRHQLEFTLLEWYRVGFDHHGLMDEVAALLNRLRWRTTERRSYRACFEASFGFNPHEAERERLLAAAREAGFAGGAAAEADQGTLLDFLFSHGPGPNLGLEQPLFVYDYPACQAALARLRPARDGRGCPVAERFELFIAGMEIANGFHELTDAAEQRRRFEEENRLRQARGQALMPVDEALLAALERGLPDCAGVALGVERLLMALTGATSIAEVNPLAPQETKVDP